jgi:hypothetical protein
VAKVARSFSTAFLADLVERDLGKFVAVFYCRFKNKNKIWAEFWWKPDKDKHEWAFFDDQKGSESYGESVTNCSGCGERLHRGMLTPA